LPSRLPNFILTIVRATENILKFSNSTTTTGHKPRVWT
jgi:hypothetical protein